MTKKFIRKYLRLAREVASDNDACYSRSLGVVVVDPVANKIQSVGYNGSPRNVPHCNSEEYLREVVYPNITSAELTYLMGPAYPRHDTENMFVKLLAGKKICPRKALGLKSGERTSLCNCEHAERNALHNADTSLRGCYLFLYGHVMPCLDCAKAIIQRGIARIYHLDSPTYDQFAVWNLRKAGIRLISITEEFVNGNDIG